MTARYDTHEQAEEAVQKLPHHGFDMQQLSIMGHDYHAEENVVGYCNMGDRMKKWGGNGAFWGSMRGMLMGSAFILIPGVGPLLLAGPLVGMLAGALEGAVVVGG
ncbi:general stress protein, partial [Hymenobacter terricola]|uniref:general stress protein n=1 Tax=Hymenobacter terricola TaxID=2819236 RepID=UPI00293D9F27